jgi:hypothetical protein
MKTRISLIIVGIILFGMAGADFVAAGCDRTQNFPTIRRAEEEVNKYLSQGCTARRVSAGNDEWYVEYCCNGEQGGGSNGEGETQQYSEQYIGNIDGVRSVATVTYERLYSHVAMAGQIQNNNYAYSFTADIVENSGFGSMILIGTYKPFQIKIVFTGSGTNEFTLISNPLSTPSPYYFSLSSNGDNEGGQVNNPPNAPTLISPANTTDYGVDASSVYFQWQNNSDPDGDELGFYIQVYYRDFNSQQWNRLGEGKVDDTSLIVSLTPNTHYAWRVFAVDWNKRSDPWYTASTWSEFKTY